MKKLIIQIQNTFKLIIKSDLIKNASVYTIGNILQSGASFFLTFLYTYFLTTKEFGIIGITHSVSNILIIILAFGINSSLMRLFYEYNKDKIQLREFISSTFLFLFGFSFIVSTTLHLFGKDLWEWVFSEIPFIPYGQLMIWTVLGDVLIQYSFNLTRAQQKPKLFMFLQIGKFMLSTILIIYFVSFRHFGARGQLLGLLIGSICTAAISSALLLKEYFSPRINWSFIQKSLVYGLPLIPHLIAQWVKTSFDRIILENYLNLEAVGIYSFGYNLGLIMNVLVTSINMAYTPYFFEMMKNNHNPKERIKKFLALYVTILGSICLFGILFSNEVIQLIIPATFHSSIPIVPLILFGYLITGYYYLAVNPLFFFMKTKWLPWLTGISASISIGLNFIIIPKWGVFGAALNFVISSFISFIFVFIASRKIWKVDLNYKGFLLLNLIIASAAASMASLGEMELNIGLIIIKLFFIIIFIYLAYILLLRRYKNSFIN